MPAKPVDNLDPDFIKHNLRTKRIGKKIIVFNATSSTNDIAAEYATGNDNDGLAVFAEEQSSGQESYGEQRVTGAPEGQNIPGEMDLWQKNPWGRYQLISLKH